VSADETASEPVMQLETDLHLKVFTMKYKEEVIAGTPLRQAKKNARDFLSTHKEDETYLSRWLSSAVQRLETPTPETRTLSNMHSAPEPLVMPDDITAKRINHGALIACKALGHVVYQWASVGDRLSTDEIHPLPTFQDDQLARRMTLPAYSQRIGTSICCSSSSFVIAAALLKRICKKYTKPIVTSATGHRLLLSSLLIALKFCDDLHGSNVYYAKLGCVSVNTLNQMEREMMAMIGYSVFVRAPEFEKNRKMLEGVVDVQGKEGLQEDGGVSWMKRMTEMVERLMS